MNNGVIYTVVVCCVWPLVVHGALLYLTRLIASRNWRSINIKFPWSQQ